MEANMVHYRRSRVAGGTYFFPVNLEDRRRTLLVDNAEVLRRVVQEVKGDHPFKIEAMAVLPDHFHAVWTMPPDDAGYARRLQLIKALFTRLLVNAGVPIAKDRRGECRLWQKRFWKHTIRDDLDLEAHVNYVHINPVKHGYVTRAVDWPYSTVHHFVKRGALPVDWACALEEGEFGEQ
jgi:putative transposase